MINLSCHLQPHAWPNCSLQVPLVLKCRRCVIAVHSRCFSWSSRKPLHVSGRCPPQTNFSVHPHLSCSSSNEIICSQGCATHMEVIVTTSHPIVWTTVLRPAGWALAAAAAPNRCTDSRSKSADGSLHGGGRALA